MPFRFPLASVLRIRESLERKEQMRLEQCYQQLHLFQLHLSETDTALHQWRDKYERQLSCGTKAVEIHLLLEERHQLELQRIHLIAQITKAQEAVAAQMQTYRAARQQRETVAQLRKNNREDYRRQELWQEQKQRDDLFLLRRYRRK